LRRRDPNATGGDYRDRKTIMKLITAIRSLCMSTLIVLAAACDPELGKTSAEPEAADEDVKVVLVEPGDPLLANESLPDDILVVEAPTPEDGWTADLGLEVTNSSNPSAGTCAAMWEEVQEGWGACGGCKMSGYPGRTVVEYARYCDSCGKCGPWFLRKPAYCQYC
jgi:hypothetical protein